MIGIKRRWDAVISMTHSIAVNFVTQDIRRNAICPGTVHASFVEDYLARSFAGQESEVRQQLGRMGQADEIAHAALYLASDEAACVTGSPPVTDGGCMLQ
jgi:2-keto-3-deoxy-L-fuconate dehydrogenase